MSDVRAKSVILRRWRDASARRQNCREIRLFNAADKENAAKEELASLFRELYPGEDIAEAKEPDDDDWDRRSSKARREHGLPPLPSYIGEERKSD